MNHDPSAHIIIDMQRGMKEPDAEERNNLDAEWNIQSLLAAWRRAGWPIVSVCHFSRTKGSPFWPGQPRAEFQPSPSSRQIMQASGDPLTRCTQCL